MEKLKEAALNIRKRSLSSNSIDERRAVVINERHSQIDEMEIKNTYKEKDTYLNLAVKYVLMTCFLTFFSFVVPLIYFKCNFSI